MEVPNDLEEVMLLARYVNATGGHWPLNNEFHPSQIRQSRSLHEHSGAVTNANMPEACTIRSGDCEQENSAYRTDGLQPSFGRSLSLSESPHQSKPLKNSLGRRQSVPAQSFPTIVNFHVDSQHKNRQSPPRGICPAARHVSGLSLLLGGVP